MVWTVALNFSLISHNFSHSIRGIRRLETPKSCLLIVWFLFGFAFPLVHVFLWRLCPNRSPGWGICHVSVLLNLFPNFIEMLYTIVSVYYVYLCFLSCMEDSCPNCSHCFSISEKQKIWFYIETQSINPFLVLCGFVLFNSFFVLCCCFMG